MVWWKSKFVHLSDDPELRRHEAGKLIVVVVARTRKLKTAWPFTIWDSTGKIGGIGRHLAETHRYFNIRFFGQMPPDGSDFPGGINDRKRSSRL